MMRLLLVSLCLLSVFVSRRAAYEDANACGARGNCFWLQSSSMYSNYTMLRPNGKLTTELLRATRPPVQFCSGKTTSAPSNQGEKENE
eukprot:2969598-Amphidinium_carterae.1